MGIVLYGPTVALMLFILLQTLGMGIVLYGPAVALEEGEINISIII